MKFALEIVMSLCNFVWGIFIALVESIIKVLPELKWLYDLLNMTWLKGLLIYGGIPIGLVGVISFILSIAFPTSKFLKTKIFQ